jgi:hypothetical protein
MPQVGRILWKVKTDHFRFLRCSSIASRSVLSAILIGILPILAAEAFATDPEGHAWNSRATAVVNAQVIDPFTTTSTAQPGNNVHDPVFMVSRRTTYRNCADFQDGDANQVTEASCELRLIELQ